MLSIDIYRQVFGRMKQDEPKLLRVSKAAHELGLHPFTVRSGSGKGKFTRSGLDKKLVCRDLKLSGW